MSETWKDVVGYEGFYKVSNLGRVMRIKNKKNTKKILKPQKGRDYLLVGLSKNGVQKTERIHRLVAEAFIDNPNNFPVVNHINLNKHDNRVENLEWCTYQFNNVYMQNKVAHPKRTTPKKEYEKKVRCVETGIVFKSQSDAARYFGISQSGIARCCKGKQKTAARFSWEYA